MKSVFLVTSGSYSDYSIVCAFETEDLAKEYVKIQRDKAWQLFLDDYAKQIKTGKMTPNVQAWYEVIISRGKEQYHDYYNEYRVEEYEVWDVLPVNA